MYTLADVREATHVIVARDKRKEALDGESPSTRATVVTPGAATSVVTLSRAAFTGLLRPDLRRSF